MYDPVIARWNVIDPMAENHYDTNSYHYVLNNPMRYRDYLGLDTINSADATGSAWHNFHTDNDVITGSEVTITSTPLPNGFNSFGGILDLTVLDLTIMAMVVMAAMVWAHIPDLLR